MQLPPCFAGPVLFDACIINSHHHWLTKTVSFLVIHTYVLMKSLGRCNRQRIYDLRWKNNYITYMMYFVRRHEVHRTIMSLMSWNVQVEHQVLRIWGQLFKQVDTCIPKCSGDITQKRTLDPFKSLTLKRFVNTSLNRRLVVQNLKMAWRDSSQSFSSDTLQGTSSEWNGDTTEE